MKKFLLTLLFLIIFVNSQAPQPIRLVMTQETQSVSLGQQYNAHTSKFLQQTVWSPEEIKEKQYDCSHQIGYNRYIVDISSGSSDTFNKLGVSAYAKISIASGLIEVSGSAKVMLENRKNTKSSFLFARQTLRNGCFRLDSSHWGNPGSDKFDATATHVVTEYHTGGDAILKFERKLSNEENEREISGKLDIAIKKFPGIDIGGGGELRLTDEEKKFLEQTSVDYIGDFPLNPSPTTYQQAIAAVQNFTRNLQPLKIPKVVILTPVQSIQSRLNRIYQDIGAHIIERFIQRAELKIRIDNIFGELKKFDKFLSFRAKITDLENGWEKHTNEFLQKSRDVIQLIRAKRTDVSALTELINDRTEQGIYKFDKVELFMRYREREIEYLKDLLDKFKKSQIERGQLGNTRRLPSSKGNQPDPDEIEFFLVLKRITTPDFRIEDPSLTFIPPLNHKFDRELYYFRRLRNFKLNLLFDDKTDLRSNVGPIESAVYKKVAFQATPIDIFEMHFMEPSERKVPKDYLIAENGIFFAGIPQLTLSDREFGIYKLINATGEFETVWKETFPNVRQGNLTFTLREDGNLVVVNEIRGRDIVVWNSETAGKGTLPYTLYLLGSGTLLLEDYDLNIIKTWGNPLTNSKESRVNIFDEMVVLSKNLKNKYN